jgi:hypothetical protein
MPVTEMFAVVVMDYVSKQIRSPSSAPQPQTHRTTTATTRTTIPTTTTAAAAHNQKHFSIKFTMLSRGPCLLVAFFGMNVLYVCLREMNVPQH